MQRARQLFRVANGSGIAGHQLAETLLSAQAAEPAASKLSSWWIAGLRQWGSSGSAAASSTRADGCSAAAWRAGLHQTQQRCLATGATAAAGPVARGQSTQRRRRRWGGLLLVPSAIAAYCGNWQLRRREWKTELLQRRQAMLTSEPADLLALKETPQEYERVRVSGRFDHAKSQYVGPRVRQVAGQGKSGYLLVTPLVTMSGRAVLVNRGWVPDDWRQSPAAFAGSQPQGEVEVEGIVRVGEEPSKYVPTNQPAQGSFLYISQADLAQGAGLPADTPLVETLAEERVPEQRAIRSPRAAMKASYNVPQNIEEKWPAPRSAEELMRFSLTPQDHMNYALTWFALSGATAAMAIKALRQGVRK